MAFAPVFGRPFAPTFDRHAAAAAAVADWWTVAGKTCVAAYQPKGAASRAASYSNLANPGTYDAAPGNAPGWSSATGWVFNGSTQYLTTGVVPSGTQTWSQIIRFANYGNGGGWLCGTVGGAGTYMILTPNYNGATNDWRIYRSATQVLVSPRIAAGVMATAGAECYLNGINDGTLSAGSGALKYEYYIGGINNGGSVAGLQSTDVLAFAIYSAVLTAGEVATLSAAMAAL